MLKMDSGGGPQCAYHGADVAASSLSSLSSSLSSFDDRRADLLYSSVEG